jgi:hypothetical protein
MEKIHQQLLNNIPNYTRFLTVEEIDQLMDHSTNSHYIQKKRIGHTITNEPLYMLDIGKGDKTAIIIGVPHSDEPLGSLVITFFAQWLAAHPEINTFNWRWLLIPILERRGMKLNEGWFNIPGSLAAQAKSNFREPTEDQYEWTFPIKYDDYEWTKSRPETLAIRDILLKEQPQLLCGLHHSGFTDGYYYFSEELPQAYEPLRKLAKNLHIPLSTSSPDVPFGKMFSPGFYQMYGLKDYLDYYQKKDPQLLPALRRGACSDEWYQNEIGGFSFNCEVPMYLSTKMQDRTLSKKLLKEVITERNQKKQARVEYSQKILDRLYPLATFADPLLLDVAQKHIQNAKSSVAHEKRMLNVTPERLATNAEVFENEVLADVFDLFLLGQIWRLTDSICIRGGGTKACRLMDACNLEIKLLAKSIQDRGNFYHVPIRNSVRMQLGSILIIADVLNKGL